MSDPTLPEDDLLRTAQSYLSRMSSEPAPRNLGEDAVKHAFSRRRRFSLAAVLGGSAVVLAGAMAAVIALAFHKPPVATTPAVTPTASASAAPSATPTPSPSPLPTLSPTPSVPTLVVSEYGFGITLTPGVLDATYHIDHSFDGVHTDGYGRKYTTAGDVDLSTRSIQANPGCAGFGKPWFPAIFEVFSTDPTHPTQLTIGSGPSRYLHVGRYWLGYIAPQYVPYSTTSSKLVLTCTLADSYIQSFSNAFDSITAAPTPASGTITGFLTFPAGGWPPGGEEVVAFRVDQIQPPVRVDVPATQTHTPIPYSLALPAGVYHVLAYPLGSVYDPNLSGAYTPCAGDVVSGTCTNGTLKSVTVTSGATVGNIDPSDWYNTQANWPKDPFPR